jgi:ligand-binding sensor domain-containing protein/signal transduction histidine kinase
MITRTLLVFFVLISLLPLEAQELAFRHLAVEDGLSQNTINCIYQDHYGFMWFGTQDGLNCYDGFRFTTYRGEPEDSASLSHNWIWDVTEDASQNLWIATWNGLTKYDRRTRTFSRYMPDSTRQDAISGTRPASLVRDSLGRIWIGIWGGGLNMLDPVTQTFTHFRDAEVPGMNYPGDYVRKLYMDHEGYLWIGTWNGLWKCRTDSEDGLVFQRYIYDPADPRSISSQRITAFCEDGAGHLWVGTLGGGLNRYDRQEDRFIRYQHDPDQSGSLSSNDLTSITMLGDGTLWIGTVANGLNRFDPNSGSFTVFYNDPADPGSISSDNVYSVFTDRGGILWVGAGGLNIYNPGLLRFVPPGSFGALKSQLEGMPVYAIYEDREGGLWAGTSADGAARLDPELGTVTWYRNKRGDPNSISSNNVSAISEDPEGNIWISTNGGGLNRMDPATGSWTHFRERADLSETTGLDLISGIVTDPGGVVWIATSDEGLIRYDPERDLFTSYRNDPEDPVSLSGNYLLRIFMDSRGDIWIGTWGAGLNKFDRDREQFIRYMHDPGNPRSITGNIIHSISEQILDTARIIWVGTASGMASFEPDHPEDGFTRSPVNSELPSRSIYGMLFDGSGKQWISTNAGITMYNPFDRSVKYYTYRDGLPGNEFNAGAFYELKEGMLAFGAAGGLLVFRPDSVNESSYDPPVVLTSFSVLNEQLYDGTSLNAMDRILLSYKQNFFSFEFASMDFSDPGKNRFMYRLEGIDEEWIRAGDRNFASYTKIDPGHYLFRVKGTNSDGRWSDHEVAIQVEITPPLWQRWWFRTVIILAVLMAFYALHLYRIRRVREIERLRTRIASDLHDDIGSALTRISVHSQQILSRTDPERMVQSTRKINELSRDTISTMSDIVWSIDARNDTLADFLGRMQDLTHTMLSEGDIQVLFTQKGMDRAKPMRVEVRQNLYYIFKEAIHNIARHSGADRVEILIDNSESVFRMEISDNGTGFDSESVKGGNGLKNMRMRAGRIGATLDIKTSNGCVIRLKMKGL